MEAKTTLFSPCEIAFLRFFGRSLYDQNNNSETPVRYFFQRSPSFDSNFHERHRLLILSYIKCNQNV